MISYYIILYHIISLFTTLSYIKPSISISIKYHEKPSNPLAMHWWSQVVSWTDKKDSFWDASIYIYIHIYRSMGRIIPYIMEKKKCLKPPTSIYIGQHPFPSKKAIFLASQIASFSHRETDPPGKHPPAEAKALLWCPGNRSFGRPYLVIFNGQFRNLHIQII